MTHAEIVQRCHETLQAVPHQEDCINNHFPNAGRCCDCDRPIIQAACMARAIEELTANLNDHVDTATVVDAALRAAGGERDG